MVKFLQNVFKQNNLKFLNTIEDAICTQSMPGFMRNTFHNGNFIYIGNAGILDHHLPHYFR